MHTPVCTDEDELAPETLLGVIAMRLPLDLQYCRLVLFGVLFGCPCDAVVMAAAMQVRSTPVVLV